MCDAAAMTVYLPVYAKSLQLIQAGAGFKPGLVLVRDILYPN